VASRLVWHRVDVAVIAATFDGVALVLQGWSGILRRAQTGSVRVYAASLLTALVVIFGYFLWHR
jgi:hypothetical protein